jgi:hypothetical protein
MSTMWDLYRREKPSGTSEHAFTGTALATRCYESHPVLEVGTGKLYGGSARRPVIRNADIYVVLQSGDLDGRQSDPWEKQTVTEVQYAIRDMEAPENVTRFKKMVTWLCNQLHDGKTVHVGCIGGHGRTGTVLSAIVAEVSDTKDAIQWVRTHYCKKAVESKEQVKFLMKHYGVADAKPTKAFTPLRETGPVSAPREWKKSPPEPQKKAQTLPEGVTAKTKTFVAMASSRSLWKPKGRKK